MPGIGEDRPRRKQDQSYLEDPSVASPKDKLRSLLIAIVLVVIVVSVIFIAASN